jgi:hypothetical protein
VERTPDGERCERALVENRGWLCEWLELVGRAEYLDDLTVIWILQLETGARPEGNALADNPRLATEQDSVQGGVLENWVFC